MTIAPYVEDPEENRGIFRQLKKLSVDIAAKNINNVNMSVLSMGMTGDYQVAVQDARRWFGLERVFSVKETIRIEP